MEYQPRSWGQRASCRGFRIILVIINLLFVDIEKVLITAVSSVTPVCRIVRVAAWWRHSEIPGHANIRAAGDGAANPLSIPRNMRRHQIYRLHYFYCLPTERFKSRRPMLMSFKHSQDTMIMRRALGADELCKLTSHRWGTDSLSGQISFHNNVFDLHKSTVAENVNKICQSYERQAQGLKSSQRLNGYSFDRLLGGSVTTVLLSISFRLLLSCVTICFRARPELFPKITITPPVWLSLRFHNFEASLIHYSIDHYGFWLFTPLWTYWEERDWWRCRLGHAV